MEMQQMMELLLAMREDAKADREEMIARMDANTKATARPPSTHRTAQT
jgi:hypothetical protein